MSWPWIRSAEATRILDRQAEDDLEAERRQQRIDETYSRAIANWYRLTEAVRAQRQAS